MARCCLQQHMASADTFKHMHSGLGTGSASGQLVMMATLLQGTAPDGTCLILWDPLLNRRAAAFVMRCILCSAVCRCMVQQRQGAGHARQLKGGEERHAQGHRGEHCMTH